MSEGKTIQSIRQARSSGSVIDQFTVRQRAGGQDAPKRVGEDARVAPVVEPPLQFFEVAVDVLQADLVERPDDRPFEQRPDALDAVRVQVPDDPLLRGVVDRLVPRVVVRDAHVALEFVGVNGLGLVPDGLSDESVERVPAHVRDTLEAHLATTLDGSRNVDLVGAASLAALTPNLSSDHRFVHFHDAKQRRATQAVVAHSLADAVAEVPRRPVGTDAEHLLHLVGADALLRDAHQVDGEEPLLQRQVSVVHDRPSRHRELVAA